MIPKKNYVVEWVDHQVDNYFFSFISPLFFIIICTINSRNNSLIEKKNYIKYNATIFFNQTNKFSTCFFISEEIFELENKVCIRNDLLQ